MKKIRMLVPIAFVILIGCDPDQNLNFHLYDAHKFIHQIFDRGTYETAAAALAIEKSLNPEVKSFANVVIRDHSISAIEIKSFAERKGIKLPDTFNTENQVELMILSQIEGVSFDNRYLADMVLSHAKDVAKFDSASRFADDDEIREWATNQLPILQKRQEEALRLQSVSK